MTREKDSARRTAAPPPPTARTLHVVASELAAGRLAAAGVPGRATLLRDPVCEGPTPAGLRDAAWYAARAAYLAATGVAGSPADLARGLAAEDAALATAPDYDEVVLWFDACLFDQLILVRALDLLSRLVLRRTRVTLLDGDAGPGERSPAQLAARTPTRRPVTVAAQALARQAWAAFRAPEPGALIGILAGDTGALPYLGAALRRHLEQFPSVHNGLSRLDQEALEVVAGGATDPGRIFTAAAAKEERPFFGAATLWATLDRLAVGPHPLVTIAGPGPRLARAAGTDLAAWAVRATATGHAVLAGHDDWVWRNGIDRWLGGVRLHGPESPWRWDTARARLVRVR